MQYTAVACITKHCAKKNSAVQKKRFSTKLSTELTFNISVTDTASY